MSVLDSLEAIRFEQDPSLMYRHSCHHSSCGTCACMINGSERLACMTNIWELKTPVVTLEPLHGFPVIGDLAVNPEMLFQDIDTTWSYLRPSEPPNADAENEQRSGFTRFENCIECGACLSVCPVTEAPEPFMGPAALAALHREMLKSLRQRYDLLTLAGGKRGERQCQRALGCSRVCPTEVYPARHIADLRRAVEVGRKDKENAD